MNSVESSNHTSPFTEGCFAPFNDHYQKNTEEEKLTILGFFVAFVIFICFANVKEWKNSILSSFSFAGNIRSIFSQAPVANEITCFHGIKTITLLILVGCHSYLFRGASHDHGSETFQKYFADGDNFTVDFLASTVDTFFVLSAILFTRSVLKDLKKQNFNYFRTILMRYFRLTPSVVFLLLFDKLLLFIVRRKVCCYDIFCYQKWWQNILHLQNLFTQTSMMCHIWTWYLAVDWQMSVIAPLFIYALYKFKWKFASLMIALIFMVSSYRVYAFDSLNLNVKDFFDITNDPTMYIKFFAVYSNTLTRCAPYLIGILLGFLIDGIETMKDSKMNLPMKYQVFCWLYVSQWFFFAQMFKIPCDLTDCKNNAMFYVFESGHKIIWSLSIGWIILACHFGVGGVVNKLLSNKCWIPISKISLSLYLIHPAVQMNFVATHPLETSFEISNVLINFISDLTMSLTLAVFMFISVEEPFRNLGKMFNKKLFG